MKRAVIHGLQLLQQLGTSTDRLSPMSSSPHSPAEGALCFSKKAPPDCNREQLRDAWRSWGTVPVSLPESVERMIGGDTGVSSDP